MKRLLLVLALAATARAEHLRGLSYDPPKKWRLVQEVVEGEELRRYRAPKLAAGEESRIDFLGPVPLKGMSPPQVLGDLQAPDEVIQTTGVVAGVALDGEEHYEEEMLVAGQVWRGYYASVARDHMAVVLLTASSRKLFYAHRAVAKTVAASLSISGPVTLRRMDVHAAVRLVTRDQPLNVMVVGGGEVELSLAPCEPEEALARVAKAAGLEIARRGPFHLLAPPDVIAALPAKVAFGGGRRVDVDFLRADAANLLRLFGDIDQKKLDSQLGGQVSMFATLVGVRDIVGWLAALGGAPLVAGRRKLSIGAGALPVSSAPLQQLCVAAPDTLPARLGCVANDQIELAGVAWPWALVRGPAPGGVHMDVVRAGERLGLDGVVVRYVGADHLWLAGGGDLPLR
jgi:hypothetical protein